MVVKDGQKPIDFVLCIIFCYWDMRTSAPSNWIKVSDLESQSNDWEVMFFIVCQFSLLGAYDVVYLLL